MFDTTECPKRIAEVEARFAEVITCLDPDGLDGEGAVALFDRLDHIEHLAAAAKALVAGRVEATEVWRGNGARDAIGFLATRSNSPRARVRDSLAVGTATGSMPRLAEAFRAGTLSVDQAADIAAAVAEHPEVEVELVSLADRVSPRELKARCVAILAEGKGADEQHRRAQAERSASASVGRDGIWRFSARLPIIDGALVDKALDHFQTQIFDDARGRGKRDACDAYRADALVAMARAAMGERCVGTCTDASSAGDHPTDRQHRRRAGRSSSIRHAIVVTVPHTAFGARGLGLGETCEVPGVGPVPMSVVNELLDHDPIIKAVVTRGRDITAVATLTRTIKDDLRLAVLAANQHTCGVPGCTNTRFLELDHEHDFAKGGPTSFDNLRPLCSYHHRLRSTEGYELRGSPGTYRWCCPDGSVLAADESITESPAPEPPAREPPATEPPTAERSARDLAHAASPP